MFLSTRRLRRIFLIGGGEADLVNGSGAFRTDEVVVGGVVLVGKGIVEVSDGLCLLDWVVDEVVLIRRFLLR